MSPMSSTPARTVSSRPGASSVADPTVGFRRVAAAVALPLGILLHLVCNTIYAVVSTESGLSDTGPASETLAFFGRYPDAIAACSILVIAAGLALVAGLPAALRVLRPWSPRLALWAVVPMMAGYVCYAAVAATNFGALGIVAAGGGPSDPWAVAALEASSSPLLLPLFALFVVGNLAGTLLLGLAAILASRRAGAEVPWWAGALIMAWPVGHALNVFAGLGEWFAVAGGALELVGLSVLALRALATSDADWVLRG